jgi:RNA polymerase sigma-70 factor (ECF subfamily)
MHPQVFAELIDRHGPALQLFARQWCESPEDVVQDAFCQLARQTTWPGDPVAWLFRTTKNRAIDVGKAARRRSRRETLAARSVRWFQMDESDSSDTDAAIAALETLIPEQREVIVARLWSDMTLEQIAEVVGCSVSTAHRRYEMGIRALQSTLGVGTQTG